MASRKLLFKKASYIHPTMATETSHEDQDSFEFNESDIFYYDIPSPTRNPVPSSRSRRKNATSVCTDAGRPRNGVTSASAPVSIPDWSKILKEESYAKRGKRESDDDEDDVDSGGDDGGGIRVPPHEYLARRRGDSFSVHEGVGRTSKGRDLNRLRNAVWKTTGFAD